MTVDEISLFWAKRDRTVPRKYHPLFCHMIDVAAVARLVWNEVLSKAARACVAAALGMEEDAAGHWIAFLAGLHDLGKASPPFQLRDHVDRPATQTRLSAAGLRWPLPLPSPSDAPHDRITAAVLGDILSDLGLGGGLASQAATIVGGHHGTFPRSSEVLHMGRSAVGTGVWIQARRLLARRLADITGAAGAPSPPSMDNATAMLLAGLVSVADWIGSNADYFPYAIGDSLAVGRIGPRAYAEKASRNAHRALRDLHWTGWSPSSEDRGFRDLFPHIVTPNHLQEAAVRLAEAIDGQSLVIIEAPMGEGKTEAAMYLVDRWATTLGQRGCYFALPTQATSNQMFGRVRDFLIGRYPTETVNLQLLHGHAALSAEVEALRADSRAFEPHNVYEPAGYDGAPPNVVVAEWFTHRKRGLLAPFGVGTIDQALLAVLQTRHVFVRLFGLAHKPVIFDEVHAYDTYMTALLERLLEWLAALGSSVVMLSATLPKTRREALLRAYASGLGAASLALPPETRYPRITWTTASAAGAQHVETSPRATKTVRLEWVDGRLADSTADDFALGLRLKAALADGGCAAVICNTVARAQQVYLALKRHFPDMADDGQPELDLLHARYLFEERQQRERRALRRFGKYDAKVELGDGRSEPVCRPSRAVLVATQIIEQSLDLDFDLMVSDLAPADLILQRIGRLHRHDRARPQGLGEPTLWLCRPEVETDGVPHFGAGNEAVYDGHVLLRSWLALRDVAKIDIPCHIEPLVEAVYGDRSYPDDLPEALRQRWDETWAAHQKEMSSDRNEAEGRWIKRPGYSGLLWRFTADPREEDRPGFHREHQALTRLAEPSVRVVFLYGTAEQPCLDRDLREPIDLAATPRGANARRLLERSLSVSDKRVLYLLLDADVPSGWRRSALLRHHRLCLLDGDSSTTVGRYRLRLNDEIGLEVLRPETEGL